MSEICVLTEQGEDNLGFLGSLNEEDQTRYNNQNKEKEDSTMRLNNPGEPTKN